MVKPGVEGAGSANLPTARRGFLEFLCVAVPKISGGICSLALNVVLIRYFGTEQFGLYAVCTTGVLLADALFGSAVDLSVVRLASAKLRTEPELALTIQKAALYLKVIAVLAVSGVLLISAGVIERNVFHQPNTSQLILLSCLATLGLMLLRTAQTNLQIERNFLMYGALEIVQMAMRYGGIAVLLVLGSVRPERVLFFYASGPLFAFLVWVTLMRKKLGSAAPVSLDDFGALARTVKWFALTFGLGALLSRLDIFLVSTWSSIGEAGIYGAAQTFALVPQLMGTYLALVYSPRLMPYLQSGRFADFFRKFQTVIIAACVAIFVLAVPALNVFGKLILPARFAAAQNAILVLLPGALAGLATFPVTMTFLMFVRPRFLFTVDCLAAPLVVLLYAYAIPRYGALGAAWVTSGSCMTRALVAQVAAWRWIQGKLANQGAPLDWPITVGEKVL
jgi:O-antigen/teichoic acid export membrane protein